MGASSVSAKAEARLVIAHQLLEDAKSLGIDVSRFEKTVSQLEKLGPGNLGASVASLMSDLSKAVEEFKHAEKKKAASIAAKVESQLTELRSLLEGARSLGADISNSKRGSRSLRNHWTNQGLR